MLKAEGIESSMFSQFLEWEGGEPGPTDETRKVSRSAAGSTEVKIKAKTGSVEVAKMIVWVVWADVTIKKGAATFSQYPNGAGVKYEVSNANETTWRFVFSIKPAKLFDLTVIDRPDFQGESNRLAPGAEVRHFLNTLGPGDDARSKWDVSRQVQFTIRNPNGVDTQGMTPAGLYANQPQEESKAVPFPVSDVEGNDDPRNNDEDGNPYTSLLPGSDLAHEIGEISSYDAPSLSVPASNNGSAAFFSKEYDFREFARLEIWDGKRTSAKFWFRISELRSWHHYLRTTFNESTNQWEDTGSSSDVN